MGKLKWISIQPLTGGMYIGAKNAIGHDAECIISYPGLNATKNDKEGNINAVGNEYHLLEWLKKNNCMVPYYTFSHKMFDDINVDETVLTLTDGQTEHSQPNFDNIDLVVAVPVCSGLSMVTSASKETKETRNNNMLFITKYTLSKIKPKMYIFENAPTLTGNPGKEIREQLEQIAKNFGYSLLYYKTDTVYHCNCQKRPRTFVVFQKWTGDKPELPSKFGLQNETIDVIDYFNMIPEDATQQIEYQMSPLNIALLEFSKYKYGENWRDKSHKRPMIDLVNTEDYDNFKTFVSEMTSISDAEKEKLHKFIDHVIYKKSLGMNFMSIDIIASKHTVPSVQFKCIYSILHPTFDRLLTVRELLHLMGMPHDFELCGNVTTNYAQIGQNVPVKTAEFIVSEAIKNINNINRENSDNVMLIDNTKHHE